MQLLLVRSIAEFHCTSSHQSLDQSRKQIMDYNVGPPRLTRRAALGAFSAAALGLIALVATKTDDSNNAINVPNLRRKLVGESLPFALVERELPLTIPGVSIEDTWSTGDARQLVQDTPPKVARSDVTAQETNERKLEGESLPFTLVERELPLSIPGVSIEDTWQ